MSSLIVLLPSSDVLAPGGWEATPMPFVQLGRNGETLRAGYAQFEALPKAGATVLVVAARDTLLLQAKLPPVTGPKLRRVLPNVVEEYLIGDAQRCHIAVGPLVPGTAEHCVAVIDRDWLSRGLAELSDHEREAVALRYGADLSAPDIARLRNV